MSVAFVDAHLEMINASGEQIAAIGRELRQLARTDTRLLALQTIDGVGPVLASHLLAEIGDARRFRRARQLVRVAGAIRLPASHPYQRAEDRPPQPRRLTQPL